MLRQEPRGYHQDNATEYIPALLIALLVAFSYSIATGIGLGFIAYVALKALAARFNDVNAAVGVIALAFLLKLILARWFPKSPKF
jgi:AGZA family xanthine/uracil permease-like MFS transporter